MPILEWARYVQMHLRGACGKKDLLPSSVLRQLQAPFRKGSPYARGWMAGERSWAGGKVLSHSGSNTMWYCVVWIAPKKDLAILVTCNQGGDNAFKACDAAVQLALPK